MRPGVMEILIILGIIILLFGARKLPELARGSGRALRIFKSEIKELNSEDTTPSSDDKGEEGDKPSQESA